MPFVATVTRSDQEIYEVDPAIADHQAGQVARYGAVAYAAWRNARVPTLVEGQAATGLAGTGKVWGWTSTDRDLSSDQAHFLHHFAGSC